ncbi:uncharacterized oxidoreductase Sfri_1503 [Acidimicrobiaceae bacterium]|nr:uncharacterized oxidoreductase Sfri_1503 [Acidimicrobiaceae bacterium]
MKIGFCGLGVMGSPMARHLASAGHDITVYNRNTEKAKQWVADHGGSFALTPREVAQASDIVMVCVGNDDDVRSVVLGADGVLAGLKLAQFWLTTQRRRPPWLENFLRFAHQKRLASLMHQCLEVKPVPKTVRLP